MTQRRHAELMVGYVLVTFLVIVGPLAYFAGVDSRIDEKARQNRFTR